MKLKPRAASVDRLPIAGAVPRRRLPHRTVLYLTEPLARDATLAGAKAANLARAAGSGLLVRSGFVIAAGARPDPTELLQAWHRLSGGGVAPVVVRSSSTIEDDRESSMAGQFRSVLGVWGWDQFLHAIDDVLASASEAGRDAAPMGVLVQAEVAPATSGVLFGVDPVTGDGSHLVADVVAGSPQPLVSGLVGGHRYVLSRRGRLLAASDGPHLLDRRQRRALAELARRVEAIFGGPQDVEWAFDGAERLWLLQSRPVTAVSPPVPEGPVLGPGPVGETFPHRLRPLEVDLWVPPLRRGIADALQAVGAGSKRRLAESPIVAVISGWVAADLDLLGMPPARHWLVRALDLRGPAHHLRVAWRVGSLRSGLASSARAALDRVDTALRRVPSLPRLSDQQLVRILRDVGPELATMHRMEVMAGVLLTPSPGAPVGASVALGALAGREAAEPDAEIVARTPVVLALTPPRVGAPYPLPMTTGDLHSAPALDALEPREALRLRARWLQELTARVATELGRRLAAAGRLPDRDAVAHLTLDELARMVDGAPAPEDLPARLVPTADPPLPAAFRLTAHGEVVAVASGEADRPAGRGAGGGRGMGVVRHGIGDPPRRGEVLVVDTMAPELAAALPGLAGLVSETGSPLSHLAIMARELGVPTVVGLPDARRRFPPGTTVVVDGRTGEVLAA